MQIVDAAFADAAQRSGNWLLCRPGCTQCCIGVFEINQLDAMRLRQGLAELKKKDPERARLVQERARESVKRWDRSSRAMSALACLARMMMHRLSSRNSRMTSLVQRSIPRAELAICMRIVR